MADMDKLVVRDLRDQSTSEYDIKDSVARDELSNVKADLSDIETESYPAINFNWVHGGIDNATGRTNNDGSLIRSRDETYYKVSDLRSITNDSTSLLFIIFYTESNGTYTFASSTRVPANSTYYFDNGEYVRFDLRGSLTQADLISGLCEIQIVSDVLRLGNDLANMLVPSVNLADPSKFTKNKYMDSSGNVGDNTSYFYTGRIQVSEGDVLYFNSSYVRYVTAFNDIVVVPLSSEVSPLTVPSGVTNVIITGFMSRIDTFFVTKNINVAFIPYEKTINRSYLKIDNKNALNGNDGITVKADTLEADTTLELSDYPKILAQHDRISGYCEFSTLGEILFGYGYGSNKHIGVDDTNISIYIDGTLSTSVPHGLTISDYLSFVIIMDDNREGIVTINSTGGSATATISLGYNKNGLPFIRSTTAITNVKLSAICKDIKNPIWWFGDSYSSLAPERIIGQLNSYGVLDRLLIDAVPGGRSYSNNDTGAYAEFIKLTKLAKPKYVVWTLGMNDTEANYKLYLRLVKNYCDIYGITLYAVKIPSVPNIDNSGKNAYIDELGIKSIDWAKAVGSTSAGVWRTGYLSSDNVHPTTLGAQAMALRTLVDCPAIMQF